MPIEIINQDCRPVLKSFKHNNRKFNLVVTSPPYNAGKAYEKNLSLDEYRDFAESWVSPLSELVLESGSLWINLGFFDLGDNRTLPLTYVYYQVCKLPLVQEVVWHYEGGMSYKNRFSHRTERWMWFSPNPRKVAFNLNDVRAKTKKYDHRNNPLGKNPTDYWFFNRVSNNSREKTSHPCQFPSSMIRRIVAACSSRDDSVLDPFMGSGSVGVACNELHRSFVGIEISRHYCRIARKRISDSMPSIWDEDGNLSERCVGNKTEEMKLTPRPMDI